MGMEDILAPAISTLTETPFGTSSMIAGILSLHVAGRLSILFLSKSHNEEKFVIPSYVIRVTAESLDILMFVLDFTQERKELLTTGGIFGVNVQCLMFRLKNCETEDDNSINSLKFVCY